MICPLSDSRRSVNKRTTVCPSCGQQVNGIVAIAQRCDRLHVRPLAIACSCSFTRSISLKQHLKNASETNRGWHRFWCHGEEGEEGGERVGFGGEQT